MSAEDARRNLYQSKAPENNIKQQINNHTELPLSNLGPTSNYFSGGMQVGIEQFQTERLQLNVPFVINHRVYDNENDDVGVENRPFILQRLPAQNYRYPCFRNIWLLMGIIAGIIIFTLASQHSPVLLFFVASLDAIVVYLIGGIMAVRQQPTYELKGSNSLQEMYKDEENVSIQFKYLAVRWQQFDEEPNRSVISQQSRLISVAKQTDRSPRLPLSLLEKLDKRYLLFDIKVFYYFQDAVSWHKINDEYQQYKREKPAAEEPLANEFQRRLVKNLPTKLMVSDLRSAPWLRYLRVIFLLIGLQYFFLRVVQSWTQRYTLFVVKQIKA